MPSLAFVNRVCSATWLMMPQDCVMMPQDGPMVHSDFAQLPKPPSKIRCHSLSGTNNDTLSLSSDIGKRLTGYCRVSSLDFPAKSNVVCAIILEIMPPMVVFDQTVVSYLGQHCRCLL